MAGLPRALGFSLALHGLLGAALLLPRALPPLAPRAPIQFTLLPPRPRALPEGPVGPADKPAETKPQPQKTPARPARPKTPRPQNPTRARGRRSMPTPPPSARRCASSCGAN